MYPAPNDTDWQVGKGRHRELVAIGQRQQLIAGALASASAPKVEGRNESTAIRRQLGAILRQAAHLLHGGRGVTPRSVPTAEGSAVA
jgi:hypothetical protein